MSLRKHRILVSLSAFLIDETYWQLLVISEKLLSLSFAQFPRT
jgi:hypothetical protein